MNKKLIGYVRVSTRDQNTDRQLIALKENGVPIENILTDRMSGKDFNRPAYRRLLKRIHKGDCLVIKSIDRLGRNYKDIINCNAFIFRYAIKCNRGSFIICVNL